MFQLLNMNKSIYIVMMFLCKAMIWYQSVAGWLACWLAANCHNLPFI